MGCKQKTVGRRGLNHDLAMALNDVLGRELLALTLENTTPLSTPSTLLTSSAAQISATHFPYRASIVHFCWHCHQLSVLNHEVPKTL